MNRSEQRARRIAKARAAARRLMAAAARTENEEQLEAIEAGFKALVAEARALNPKRRSLAALQSLRRGVALLLMVCSGMAATVRQPVVNATAVMPATRQVVILKADGTRKILKAKADTDASRGALLLEAQAAAASGDKIVVEAPGTYQLPSPLGKNGVNWHFGNGVLVYSALDTVWSDGGTAMVFKVTGEGEFQNDQNVPHLIDISHASSAVVFYGRSFWCNSNAGAAAVALYVDGGASVKIYASEYIRSDDYDGVWVNDGTVEIYTPLLEGADQGLELGLNADSVIAQAQRIHGDVNPVEYGGGALRIIGAKLTGANGLICNHDGLTLQDCELAIDGATSITAGAARVVKVAGTLTANKALHANVTLSGGAFVLGSDVALHGFMGMPVVTEPAAPGAGGRLFIDTSGGKARLRVRFPSGASQTIATEP